MPGVFRICIARKKDARPATCCIEKFDFAGISRDPVGPDAALLAIGYKTNVASHRVPKDPEAIKAGESLTLVFGDGEAGALASGKAVPRGKKIEGASPSLFDRVEE